MSYSVARRTFVAGIAAAAGVAAASSAGDARQTVPKRQLVVTGIDSMPLLDQAVAAATAFRPMTQAEQRDLLARTRSIGLTGEHQKMKTSYHFDSTHENPQWLGPSGEGGTLPGQ